MSAGFNGLPKGHFTYMFVDEAAQVYIAAYITMYICMHKLYKLKYQFLKNIRHFLIYCFRHWNVRLWCH